MTGVKNDKCPLNEECPIVNIGLVKQLYAKKADNIRSWNVVYS